MTRDPSIDPNFKFDIELSLVLSSMWRSFKHTASLFSKKAKNKRTPGHTNELINIHDYVSLQVYFPSFLSTDIVIHWAFAVSCFFLNRLLAILQKITVAEKANTCLGLSAAT